MVGPVGWSGAVDPGSPNRGLLNVCADEFQFLGRAETKIEGEIRPFVCNRSPNSIAPTLSRLRYGVPDRVIQFKTQRARAAEPRCDAAALNPGD